MKSTANFPVDTNDTDVLEAPETRILNEGNPGSGGDDDKELEELEEELEEEMKEGEDTDSDDDDTDDEEAEDDGALKEDDNDSIPC